MMSGGKGGGGGDEVKGGASRTKLGKGRGHERNSFKHND